MTRYEILPKPVKIIFLVMCTIGLGLFIVYIFGWSFGGWVLEQTTYYYLLYATFGACIFLVLPERKKDQSRIPWYDLIFATLMCGACIYFVLNADRIGRGSWVPPPSMLDLALACIIGFLALNAARRAAGWPFFIVCLIFGSYPLIAPYMPGVFEGFGLSFPGVIGVFAYGKSGMIGLGAMVLGDILVGFLLFSGVMTASGAGKFFLDIALALFGTFRGGPAKVAVVSSAFFGMLSGAGAANVVATGTFTIPAMKRIGYPPHYAGAIEAVASSGGIITPPIMGAIAFIMSMLTGIPYATICVAAALPAILYYWGVLVQIDGFAAGHRLKGLPREECPSLLKTLKEGWQFIIAIAFLAFGLIYMRWGAVAPVYTSALMFILSFARRETMMTPKRIAETLAEVGKMITYLTGILLAVGFIMIGLQLTGTLTALIAKVVDLGGASLPIVLIIMVVICYLMGMVGIALVAYILLAVVAIPPLIASTGLNTMALHLFVVYYFLVAGITPPVCVTAFVAAGIAGAPPMKTGWTASRLAVVVYFVPFFFLFRPSLILQGPILETIYLFALCLFGIAILASGLEGYLVKIGKLGWWSRPLLVAAGFLITFPSWQMTIVGVALASLVIAIILIRRAMAAKRLMPIQ